MHAKRAILLMKHVLLFLVNVQRIFQKSCLVLPVSRIFAMAYGLANYDDLILLMMPIDYDDNEVQRMWLNMGSLNQISK